MKNNILKKFIHYVSLNVLGMIGLSCYILADTFFVSNALGPNGLAALNFSISIYCVINGVGLMIGIGGATKYTILKSQKEDTKANSVYSQVLVVGIGLGLFFALVGLLFSKHLATLLGADDFTSKMTSTYLKTLLCFSPFFITNNVLLAFIRNDGNPKLSMAGMLIGSFSNIIIDYIFIFLMSMGLFGAALATGLAPLISISTLLLHFIRHRNKFNFIKFKPSIKTIGKIISLGFSAFITEVSSGIVLIIFNLVIMSLAGNIGVAAYGIVANIALVIVAIFTGISQGIQPLVSNGYGRKDNHLIYQVLRYAVILSFTISIMMYFGSVWFSENIIAIFNNENNTELCLLATNGFKLYFIGFFFAGINIISAAFLSAINSPKAGFVISIIRGCIVLIPIVFIMSELCGMNGVWLSFTLTEALTFIISILCLIKIQPFYYGLSYEEK